MARRRLTRMLAGGGLVLAAALAPVPVSAVGAEYVSGSVTSGGQSLAGVRVNLWRLEGPGPNDFVPRSSGVTDVNGRYSIDVSGLVPDSYALGFHTVSGSHWPEYYDDAPIPAEGSFVQVGDGVSNLGLDVDLAVASRITGRITDKHDNPLNVKVIAYSTTGDALDYNVATPNHLGDYSIGPLPAGTYQLEFSDPAFTFATEYWDDQATMDTAAEISVGTGGTAGGYDAVMSRGGHLAGTVRDIAGAAVRNLEVLAYRWDTAVADWVYLNRSSTNSSGAYNLFPLKPGGYRLCFANSDDTLPVVVDECWEDQPALAAATTIPIADGQQAFGIDAVVSPQTPPGDSTLPPTPTPTPTPTPAPTTPVVTPTPTTSSTVPPAPGPQAPGPDAVVAAFIDGVRATGKLRVGKTLRLTNISATGISVSVQWYAGKMAIKEATQTRLKLVRSLKGKPLKVKVTAKSRAGGLTAGRTLRLGKVR